MSTSTTEASRFWDGHYTAHLPDGEPRANVRLVEVVSPLAPGRALDLGSGAGGDALWLARRGWHVTAADISAVALAHLGRRARDLGLADRITGARHDLAATFPAGPFDLVSAHYLHTSFPLPRDRVLRQAAEALSPGGRLLVVEHGSVAPWSWNQDPASCPPLEAPPLDPAVWTVERADALTRRATGPGGQAADVVDHLLLIHRTR
ncbi:methyltransferase [Amycolatopsis mediterranei S699]|uniref:Methyltransferase n=2 Tax=Amycolatopsis mediterranei TaxID=33910 RepID=A0A0H3D2Y6_AMYMU|nr:class I SAM-dependent methyltransferase [Amycolatopsis mediterranei]ADJ45000.1 methyltransferase [Amycolatopsis mediterranei U32]AEK41752.1 methyltransferase [Amycolatopsis mediterranei S699]AFO76711.1 methyltransferase [Amycolatopsis mediterranei S699]AGT83839.1 methyltransferase [Amycolatopsis mediterranei RB]KDO07174.1 methyltransferase [Amycolatopsis mediterranei]